MSSIVRSLYYARLSAQTDIIRPSLFRLSVLSSAALASAKTLAFLIGADQTSLQNALSIERSHQFQESDLRLSSEVVESVESHIGHKSVFAKTRSAAFGSAPSWASSSRGYGGGRASTADSPGGGSGSGRDSRAQSGFFSSGGSGNENGSGRESATQGTNEVLNRLKTTGMGGFAIGENGGVDSSSGGEGVTPRAERPESAQSGAQAGNNGSGIYTSVSTSGSCCAWGRRETDTACCLGRSLRV